MAPEGNKGAPKPNRQRIELINHTSDEPLVDHKGRSKPLYKRRTQAPTWRPSRFVKVLLGLFPGARLMALVDLKRGLPYGGFGLVFLFCAVWLLNSWSRTSDSLGWFKISDHWMLVHAGAILLVLITFEVLRLGAALGERTGPSAPRVMAAFLLPALLILMGAPLVMPIWPKLCEATWFAALFLALGAIPAAVWCAFEGTLLSSSERRRFRTIGFSVLALAFVGLLVTGVMGVMSLDAIVAASKDAGFQVLPRLLG